MNYYERHLGDYVRDTVHLSMIEDGAYNRFLDRYYATEQGIPDDQKYRVARAHSKEEKTAVDTVLAEFFTLESGLWIKRRVQEEIAKAQSKIKSAQENGKRGGRPKNNPDETEEKPNGLFVGSKRETQQKAHQTPDTRHQSPDLVVIKSSSNTQDNYSEQRERSCVTTTPGDICKRMIELGIEPTTCNPGHQTLDALIKAGAEIAEFEGAAKSATAKGKPDFKYALGIVKKQREDAAQLVLHKGVLPDSAKQKKFNATEFVNSGRVRDGQLIDIN